MDGGMGENERAKARATEKEAWRERKATIKKNPLSEKKVKYKTIKIKKEKRTSWKRLHIECRGKSVRENRLFSYQ